MSHQRGGRWWAVAGALATLAGGCGGGGSGSTSSAASACADYASKTCAAAQKCEPGVVQYFYPGGLPSCVSTAQLSCELSLGAPHTGATPSVFEQCGDALGSMTCDQYLSATNAASCLPHGGTIANGGSCGDSWQCASGRCSFSDASCGTCVAQVALGSACTGSECGDNLVCAPSAPGSTSYLCSTPVSRGDSCFDSSVCPGNTLCGVTTGTCDPLPTNGDACDPQYALCDLSSALSLCDPFLSVCEPVGGMAQPGQACGWISATAPYLQCDGYCALASGTDAGTCFAMIAQGQPCTSADYCAYNLQCTGGVCAAIGSTICDGTPLDAGSGPIDAVVAPPEAGADATSD